MDSNPRVRVLLDLFDQHYESVARFARRSVDHSTADDVTQEVFARLLRLPDLETREIRVSYLIKIAENLIRRRYRTDRRFATGAARSSRAEPRETWNAEREGPSRVEVRERAHDAVSRLGDHEREAVELVVGRGLSYRQAAESMGVKVSDVNNWRHRGVEKMRRGAEGARYDRAE